MKIIDCVQGSPEWLRARMGVPTASNFNRILTRTGKASTSATGYMHELIAELMIGRPLEEKSFAALEHGKEFEPEAVKLYEFEYDIESYVIGFMTNDAGTIGASPDRGVGDDELLEIKCPFNPAVHVGYYLAQQGGVDDKYWTQLQGQLYVSERKAVTIVSYHREMPMAVVRVKRDEEYIAKLGAALGAFVGTLKEIREKLDAEGHIRKLADNAAQDFAEFISDEDVDLILSKRGESLP